MHVRISQWVMCIFRGHAAHAMTVAPQDVFRSQHRQPYCQVVSGVVWLVTQGAVTRVFHVYLEPRTEACVGFCEQ